MDGGVLDGPEGVGNVEAQVDVVVGRLRGGSTEFGGQEAVRTGLLECDWGGMVANCVHKAVVVIEDAVERV